MTLWISLRALLVSIHWFEFLQFLVAWASYLFASSEGYMCYCPWAAKSPMSASLFLLCPGLNQKNLIPSHHLIDRGCLAERGLDSLPDPSHISSSIPASPATADLCKPSLPVNFLYYRRCRPPAVGGRCRRWDAGAFFKPLPASGQIGRLRGAAPSAAAVAVRCWWGPPPAASRRCREPALFAAAVRGSRRTLRSVASAEDAKQEAKESHSTETRC